MTHLLGVTVRMDSFLTDCTRLTMKTFIVIPTGQIISWKIAINMGTNVININEYPTIRYSYNAETCLL